MKIDLVVTRHGGLVEFLRRRGLVDENVQVVAHVSDPSILDGKVVAGVLPVNLAARTTAYCSVNLDLPLELRGKELTAEQTEQYCTGVEYYCISLMLK
jgi:putative CRISPR-associated protein (TIGR02620 family)